MASKTENILQVSDIVQLSQLLSKKEYHFFFLGLTDNNTDEPEKKKLKKILKEYSKKLPQHLFIYYQIKNQDINRISLIKSEGYPWFYCILLGKKLYFQTNELTDITRLMDDRMEYFNMPFEQLMTGLGFSNQEIQKMKYEKMKNQSKNQSINTYENENKEQQSTNMTEEEKELERRKNIERIKLLYKRSDEQEKEYMRSLAKRKQIEEEVKEDNDEQNDNEEGSEDSEDSEETVEAEADK
jgi:hypothetical protein